MVNVNEDIVAEIHAEMHERQLRSSPLSPIKSSEKRTLPDSDEDNGVNTI